MDANPASHKPARCWFVVGCSCLLLPFLLMAVGPSPGFGPEAQGSELSEYAIKAAYLYNFAKFVEWPSDTFADKNAPLTIAVVGNDPFGPLLDQCLNGKNINNRPFVVQRVKWPADLRKFQIVFIGSSEERRIPKITESLQGAPVLTVSETELVTRSKCVINFVVEAQKVRFEVDIDSAEQARLKISSKLLMLARVFKDGRLQGKG